MSQPSSNRWCILRTGGGQTVRLARSLADAGIEAWTPVERLRRRVPRSKAVEYVLAAVTPTYVFVRERHLEALRLLERQAGHGHPRFSIFRYYGGTVFIRHRMLQALRERQQDSYRDSLPVVRQVVRKERGEIYNQGDRVKLKNGPLEGFECVVEDSDGLTTTLTLTLFGRQQGVKVSTSQLRADNVTALASAA